MGDWAPVLFGDYTVDIADLTVFTEHWLTCPGIVAWWTLDETTGDVAYDRAHTWDGQLYGHPIWQPTQGKFGGALALDGIDDYLQTDLTWDTDTRDFSVLPGFKAMSQDGSSLPSQTPATGCAPTPRDN